MGNDAKTTCRTPTTGRNGVTRIPTWKYLAVRTAILDVVREAADSGIAFSKLGEAVQARMSSDDLAKLGSVGWHVTSVKLNMEVEGELKRMEVKGPQRLILA